MKIQINAATRLTAATKVQAGKYDAALLKYLSGAVTQKLDKADIKTLTYKTAANKITVRGFGVETVITQKTLDRYPSIQFTVDDIEMYLHTNGAKPFKAGKSRSNPPLYD